MNNSGFFRQTNGATIRNLTLENYSILAANTKDRIGGLIGGAIDTTIENVAITGTSFITGGSYVGGLVGDSYRGVTIIDSHVNASVTGTSYVGGLVGAIEYHNSKANAIKAVNGTVYASGSVTGISNVGGLIGDADHTTFLASAFDKIYANNTVTGYMYTGGLVGYSANSTYTYVNADTTLLRKDYGVGTYNYFGGLIGYSDTDTIDHAKTTGTIALGTDASTYDWIGGLIGEADGATISNAFSSVAITLPDSSTSSAYIGGLIGYTYQGSVTKSYATGNVNANNATLVGGLIGYAQATALSSTYATGAVTGKEDVGGLVGLADIYSESITSIINSYATGLVTGTTDVGGLVGLNSGSTITHSYYDKTINSTLTANADNVGKTTDELKTLATFSENWSITQDTELGTIYPQLAWKVDPESNMYETVWVIGQAPSGGGSTTLTPDISHIENGTAVQLNAPQIIQLQTPPQRFNLGGQSVALVSTPSGDTPTQLVGMQEVREMLGGSAGEVRVPLGQNSLIQLVNGGVRLPSGVEQEFFMAQR